MCTKQRTSMKTIYFFIICVMVLVSCQNKTADKNNANSLVAELSQKEEEQGLLFDIDLEKVLQGAEKNQLPLSDFFKEIEYIPLQTTSKSLIGGGLYGIQQYMVTDKVIVADMKIFSRQDGHYIGNLLKQGQGPQEYLYIMSIDADDEREEFYLYDSSLSRIHVVGYDNMYKGAVGGCSDYADVLSFGNGNILIPNYSSFSKRSDVFFIDNVDSKEIVYKRISPALQGIAKFEDCKRIGKLNSYTAVIGSIANTFWKYKNEIRYYDTLTDTVYTINKKYEIRPIGRLDTEKIRMSYDQWRIGMMSRNFYTWNLHRIDESDDYLLLALYKTNPVLDDLIHYWVIYSKCDGKIISVKFPPLSHDLLFFNDLDQGVSLIPFFSTSSGDGICCFLPVESIKEYIAEKGPAYFTTEKGKAFKAMGDRLKYDDNEVVAIMKWK